MLADTGWAQKDFEQLVEKLGIVDQLDVDSAFDNLLQGDRDDATQMTFIVTLEQAEQIRTALKMALSDGAEEYDSGNKNKNGVALAYIIQGWLNARG